MDIKAQKNDIIENAIKIITGIETRQKGLPTYDRKGLSSKTKSEYKAIAINLMKGDANIAQLIYKAKNTKSKRTWYKRRAALTHVLIDNIRAWIKLIESGLDSGNNDNLLGYIKLSSEILRALESTPSIENPVRAKSKKQDLKGLPDDWRQIIIAIMPNYKLAILTLSLTGCRPGELVKGVEWSITNGELTAVIQGTKIGEYSGQDIRELTFKIEGEFAEMLAKEIRNAGGRKIVKIESAVNITTAIRAAGKRALPKFKKTLTAYSFRHQFSCDGKARAHASADPKAALVELSAALGHATDLTKRHYGNKEQVRSGGVGPEKVITSRSIKQIKRKDFGVVNKRIKNKL